MKRASIEATIKRGAGYAGDPCEGHVMYDTGESSYPASFDPQRILGRVLGEGTRVRVTVTVLEDVPVKDKCLFGRAGSGNFGHTEHKSDVVTVGFGWRERAADREAARLARNEEARINNTLSRAAHQMARRQGARA